jgi:beta-glucosidase
MGYRWYDANGITPAFPFGHGLSYTTFAYSDLQVSPKVTDGMTLFTVTFMLQNTGNRAGAEVAQVYASFPFRYGEPPKRLVGFEKVWLDPGEYKKVTITVDPGANNHPLSYWDSKAQKWTLMRGPVTLHLARSALDLEDSAKVIVTSRHGRHQGRKG